MNGYVYRSILAFLGIALLATLVPAADAKFVFQEGKPDLKSAGPLAFGPAGILFVADTSGATIFAIDTADVQAPAAKKAFTIESLDTKIAALLGTSPDEILIKDLAVNPLTGTPYLAVSRGRGPDAAPVILRVSTDGALEVFATEKVKFSKAALPDAPAPDAVRQRGKRKSPLRQESITDLAFVDGRLLVAGLSNEEFSSSLRSIPLPFKNVEKGSVVKIYHGAHGKFETHSPVRTFVPMEIAGEMTIVAAYTCTPLVMLPVSELKAGAHVQGTTVAELGNRNRPLDMITYEKNGKDFILIANNNRGIMKVATAGIDSAAPITERVGGGGTKGQPYETIEAWKGIEQLDRLNEKMALVIRRTESGTRALETRPLP
jgi:hypothetical protein